MQIVIDIPHFIYEQILKGHVSKKTIARIFRNGTPLPKGHGDLIDREEALDECYTILFDGERFKVVQYETLLDAPSIIEADKESEET